MINALLFERPIWFATGPLTLEEHAQEMEEFPYHRPVLVNELIELLAPRPGALVVDGTCGGGGHGEAILQPGADVLGLDQDPDAISHATERLSKFGGGGKLRQRKFCGSGKRVGELGIATIGGAAPRLRGASRP